MNKAAQGEQEPITAPLLATLIKARDMRAGLSTSQPLPDAIRAALKPFAPPQSTVHLTESECIEMDALYERWKQSGGPARDSEARAVKLELQWAEAMRLGGQL